MISIFIISHTEIANSFAYCLEHIHHRASEIIERQLLKADGVLVLSDIFGATPSNIATKLTRSGKVELITGLNLPMLLRAISYSNRDLSTCSAKALEGGINGIVHINGSNSDAN